MKRCVRCATPFSGQEWRCPACGYAPDRIGGFPAFAPELAGGGEGFDPALFSELARLEARNFWFRARNRLIVWALKRFFDGAQSLLEIGCGTGFVLSGIAAAFPNVRLAGSEVNPEGLGFAASRVASARLMQMDARRIPFEAEFDVVGAFDVIEHIDDDRTVLREMHRAVKPGGGILLTVPQHRFLWSEYDVRARHVRRYTADELRGKVLEAGFRIVRMTSFVALLLPLMLLSRLAKRAPRDGYDPLAELRLAAGLNAFFEAALAFERGLIRAGATFPAGGSLLVVARRPLDR
ncbi:MAG: methyltransferase [Betaproteobacteria bacterium RIFCSPLOWO2_12_FULL_62_13]|nr:MAG: methyltransferase [Betaproteobacteria bacterium RIFCSPLOWO2_12_FULL_62_13]